MGSLLPSKLQPTVSSTLCSRWFPHHIHLPCNQSLFSPDSKLPFAASTPLCVQSCDTHHVQDDQSCISLVRQGVRTMQTVPLYEASMDTVNRGGAALVGTLMGVSGVASQVGKKKTYQDIQKGLNKEK